MLVDVEQILRALDAPPGLVAEVSALARMANTEWRNLRELRRKGLGTRQAECVHHLRRSLVTIETTAGSLVLRDGRDALAYLNEFAGYEQHALFGDDLRARLAEWSAACRA
ncbi:hypothetical protein [Streptomyces althioticus]|uniref:hypothetical protein n=1 Tax=Streptomyces althioticus TaxID=83380 RepID=UPI0037F642C9